jgi:cytochrome c-type biogenesis protein CcmH/NrfG
MSFPYIYTFYSYKGGVGRSLALLNVAYTLAGRGRHVLMIDMDLEAPGISGFLQRQNEVELHHRPAESGVLALLEAAMEHLPCEDKGLEAAASALPPLDTLLWSVRPERLETLKPNFGLLGRLDVLGEGLNEGYFQRLENLGLKSLAHDGIVRLSNLLRLYFKAHRFPFRPLGVEDFEEPVQTPYDYILIDSRTGVTEIGGLCVGPLADRLVVLTGLNDQNVEGTATLLKEIGIQLQPRKAGDPAWDEADPVQASPRDAPALGPKPTLLVATPVPSGETELKRQRLKDVTAKLGIRPLTLSYFPRLALMETLMVRDFAEEHLSGEYKGLVSRVMAQIGDDEQSLMLRFTSAVGENADLPAAVKSALRLAPIAPELSQFVLRQAHNATFRSSEWTVLRGVAAHLAVGSVHRDIALGSWGLTLGQQANLKQGAEADRLFALAYTKYAESVRINPDQHEVYLNWGNALSYQANQKQGEEADRLFASAYEKYAESLRIKPDKHEAYSNWGSSLSDQANQKKGEEADRLFALAYTKCADSLRIKPDQHEAYLNWGNALLYQASQKQGKEADRLFALAYEKYAESLRIKPDQHKAHCNWGLALTQQAVRNRDVEADRLFALAYEKYENALRIVPGQTLTLGNWGITLIRQSLIVTDPERVKALRRAAREKLLLAHEIEPNRTAYNLACLNALESNAPEALQWLAGAFSNESQRHLVTQARIAAESDFDNIRNDPDFVRFVATLPME